MAGILNRAAIALAVLVLAFCVPLGADDTLKNSVDKVLKQATELGPIIQQHLNEAYRDGGVMVLDVLIHEFEREPEGSSYDREGLLKSFRRMRRAAERVDVKPKTGSKP